MPDTTEPPCRSSWHSDTATRPNPGDHDELVDGEPGFATWPPRAKPRASSIGSTRRADQGPAVNLDAIRAEMAHIVEIGQRLGLTPSWGQVGQHVPALAAEVERLRPVYDKAKEWRRSVPTASYSWVMPERTEAEMAAQQELIAAVDAADPDVVSAPPPIAARVRDGHQLEWDPPANILTSVVRWTCVTCGDAVLVKGTVVYGGATERTCDESVAFWSPGGGS